MSEIVILVSAPVETHKNKIIEEPIITKKQFIIRDNFKTQPAID